MDAAVAIDRSHESLDDLAREFGPEPSANDAPAGALVADKPPPGVVGLGDMSTQDAIATALMLWRESNKPHADELTDEGIAAVAWADAKILDPLVQRIAAILGQDNVRTWGPLVTAIMTTVTHLRGPVAKVRLARANGHGSPDDQVVDSPSAARAPTEGGSDDKYTV